MSEDVFEITDFTTASDWERFVSDLEEVIQRWDLCSGSHLNIGEKHETIRFSKTQFSLVFHKSGEIEAEEEVESRVTCPPQVLSAMRGEFARERSHCLEKWFSIKEFLVLYSNEDSIGSEDRLRLVLSAVTLALTQTTCLLPVLVQTGSRARRLYSGVCLNTCLKSEFQMIQSNHVNKQFTHLSHFLDLFKDKIGNHAPTVTLSVRLTFALNQFPINEDNEDSDQQITADRLVFTSSDPLLELQMSALWLNLAEDVVIDSENHSDLNPNATDLWTIRALFRHSIDSTLSQSIQLIVSLLECEEPVLEPSISHEISEDIVEALTPLTRDTQSHKWVRDLAKEVFKESETSEEELYLKSAPFGGIAWKTSIALANIYRETKDLKVLKLFWREFCARLTQRWDECCPLMAEPSNPDFRFSVFHQKLQLLNKCIFEKRAESGDEFFDAEESIDGRLRRSDLRLLDDRNEWIYIPETQDSSPMTEDMIGEQMALLSRVDPHLRARVQCCALVSDMEAFKAANPCARFEDFVRWHSPRDWVESALDGLSGELSPRFAQKDNIWRELWDSARPLAAKLQKKLFDYITEAEKVLHFLTSLSFKDLADLVIGCVTHSSVKQINEKSRELGFEALDEKLFSQLLTQHSFEAICDLIGGQQIKLNRFQSLRNKFRAVSEREMSEECRRLSQDNEIQISSFSSSADAIRDLFRESESQKREQMAVGEREASERSLPDPISKEFILKVWTERPNESSRRVPQRMYCLWTESELRIAGIFSEDITF